MAVICVDGTIEDDELARLGVAGLQATVNLVREQVRACMSGPTLARAIAIAGLRDVQLARLFPDGRRTHALNLRQIGNRLRGEKARRELVCASFRALWEAARHEGEEEQIAAAVAYRFRGSTRAA